MAPPYRYIRNAFSAWCNGVHLHTTVTPVAKTHTIITQLLSTATPDQLSSMNRSLAVSGNRLRGNFNERQSVKFLEILATGFGDINIAQVENETLDNQNHRFTQMIRKRTFRIAGPVYMNSFLSYAPNREYCALKSSWDVAKKYVAAGAVMSLQRDHHDLVGTWFGASPGASARVRANLKKVQKRMESETTFVGYRGANMQDAGHYMEIAYDVCTNFETPSTEQGEIAKGARDAPYLFVAESFFPGLERLPMPHRHIGDIGGMTFTKPGALIHELTHNACGTNDVVVSNAVAGQLNLGPLQTRTAYGVRRCLALAKDNPQDALDNADSYRQFCEDAAYFLGVA